MEFIHVRLLFFVFIFKNNNIIIINLLSLKELYIFISNFMIIKLSLKETIIIFIQDTFL